MGLMHKIQMPHHLPRSGGGGGHQEMVFAQPRRGAVIHDETIFAQHQPIAHPTDGQGAEKVPV